MTDMTDEQKKERPVYTESAGRDFLDNFYNPNAEEGEQPKTIAADDVRPLDEQCVEVLRDIYDPEIPVNIYELGLIYDVSVYEETKVLVTMTLTTPHCPVAETMPDEIKLRLESIPSISHVDINLVWEPPWDPSRMTEEARLELGFI